jgi:uncharacterized membrane protein
VIAAFSSKVGAVVLDKTLFIFISYGLGCFITFFMRMPARRLEQNTRDASIKFGIMLGVINFVSYFLLMSALTVGPGVLVFPLVSMNLAFTVAFSMLIFKERLNLRGTLGFILALAAILLLK